MNKPSISIIIYLCFWRLVLFSFQVQSLLELRSHGNDQTHSTEKASHENSICYYYLKSDSILFRCYHFDYWLWFFDEWGIHTRFNIYWVIQYWRNCSDFKLVVWLVCNIFTRFLVWKSYVTLWLINCDTNSKFQQKKKVLINSQICFSSDKPISTFSL